MRRFQVCALAIAIAAGLAASPLRAQSETWAANAAGNWSSVNNWSGSSAYASGADQTANFSVLSGNANAVTDDVPSNTIGTLVNGGQAAWGIAKIGIGSLTLTNTASMADTYFTGYAYNADGGALALSYANHASNLLPSTVGVSVAQGGTLYLLGNSSAATSSSQTLSTVAVLKGGGSIVVNPDGGDGGAGSNLVKFGVGVFTLDASNAYSGYTAVNQGTLVIGPSGGVNTTTANVANGASLLVTGGTLTSSSQTTVGTHNAGGGYFSISSGVAEFNGGIDTTTNGDGAFIGVLGGSFSASSINLGRTQTIGGNSQPGTPSALRNSSWCDPDQPLVFTFPAARQPSAR